MARKKWTAKTEITEELLTIREKRKWQLAFRRYVLEGAPSEKYAWYFGLDAPTLRRWFESQFTEGLNWGNFGKAWQFAHVIPATYFDYSKEDDLQLCWNYLNMRVETIGTEELEGIDNGILFARHYFESLSKITALPLCRQLLDKIRQLENTFIPPPDTTGKFLLENKELLEACHTLSREEFGRLSTGTSLNDILTEREILRKFGSGS